jgi:hypothetical protein
MFKRLLQAATITFLLHLLANMNQPTAMGPRSVSSSQSVPPLMLGLR